MKNHKRNNKSKGIDYVNLIDGNSGMPLQLRLTQHVIRLGAVVLPNTTAKILTRMFLTPKKSQVPKDFFDPETTKFLTFNGKKIFTVNLGEGPKILVVHGWGSSTYKMRHLIDHLLANGFSVMAFDAPANGLSSGKTTHGMEISDLILQVEKEFGSFHGVVTHSFGGFATMLALRKGFSPSRIVAISMPTMPENMFHTFNMLLDVPEKLKPRMLQQFERTIGATVQQISPLATDLSLPTTLLIHDKDDMVIHHKEAKLFAEKNQYASLVLTKGLGHRKILTDHSVFAMITDFLSEQLPIPFSNH